MNKLVISSFLFSSFIHMLFLCSFTNKTKKAIYKFTRKQAIITVITKTRVHKNNKGKRAKNFTALYQVESQSLISKPTAKGVITPNYPYHSKIFEEEGRVGIKVFINNEGVVIKTEIIVKSGFERLDNEALRSVLKADFKPAMKNGVAISSSTILYFNFNLK